MIFVNIRDLKFCSLFSLLLVASGEQTNYVDWATCGLVTVPRKRDDNREGIGTFLGCDSVLRPSRMLN